MENKANAVCFFFFFPDAIRLRQIGKSVCKEVSKQVQVVIQLALMAPVVWAHQSCALRPMVCDTQQPEHTCLTEVWQMLTEGARGTDHGFYVI